MRNRLLILTAIVMAAGAALTHSASAADNLRDGQVPGTPFIRKTIQDDSGRSITYYISRPRAAAAPILLMIQG